MQNKCFLHKTNYLELKDQLSLIIGPLFNHDKIAKALRYVSFVILLNCVTSFRVKYKKWDTGTHAFYHWQWYDTMCVRIANFNIFLEVSWIENK